MPSKLTLDELFQNDLIHTYINEISYEYTDVDKRQYKRNDPLLLNMN